MTLRTGPDPLPGAISLFSVVFSHQKDTMKIPEKEHHSALFGCPLLPLRSSEVYASAGQATWPVRTAMCSTVGLDYDPAQRARLAAHYAFVYAPKLGTFTASIRPMRKHHGQAECGRYGRAGDAVDLHGRLLCHAGIMTSAVRKKMHGPLTDSLSAAVNVCHVL